MSDEELAQIIDELTDKTEDERNEFIESKGLSADDTAVILEAIDALKDLVEEKAAEQESSPETEDSGADETLTEDLSEGAETVDVDGDGDDDAVVIEEETKHGDEDKPHEKVVSDERMKNIKTGIKPVNILKALSAFKY